LKIKEAEKASLKTGIEYGPKKYEINDRWNPLR
jgi:hypothetical protein